jgi:hypothetical protein
MKLLIQSHPQYNLVPMTNAIRGCISTAQVVVFDETFDPIELLQKFQPDVTIYHSDIVHQNLIDIVNNANGAKIQHVIENSTPFLNSNWQFSLSNTSHENYFAPRCNTFILKDPLFSDKFAADLSFLGPPSQHAAEVLSSFMDISDPITLRIYGQNKYLNWRYAGTVEELDLKDIYVSSGATLCFNPPVSYDFRVLDCVYAGGRPIIERNDRLIEDLPMLEDAMFEQDSDSRHNIIRILNGYRDGFLDDNLRHALDIIKKHHSWHDLAVKIFNGIGLKSAAKQIQLTKERVV